MGTYTKNLESGRIQLTFTKAEYKDLSAEQVRQLKHMFMWAPSQGSWVSRRINDLYAPVKFAESLHFTYEGEIGEKLSFGDKLEAKAERATERAERYEDRSERSAAESTSAFLASREAVAGIEPGQPILVGHHSEGRHRAAIARMDRYMRKSCDAQDRSKYYADRAAVAASTATMSQLSNLPFLGRRIEQQEVALRDIQRKVEKATKEGWQKSLDRLEDAAEEILDKLAFYQSKAEKLGGFKYDKTNIKKGDLVSISGSWKEVIRVNEKTVSVKTPYSWTNSYPYYEIVDHRSPDSAEAPEKAL